MNKTLIIIPAYNEEDSIAKVIKEVQVAATLHDVVVIDDGSQDSTGKITQFMGVNTISHPINLGAGAAIQTGLIYACQNNYDIAVVVDGDGQHDPKEIPKLVDTLKERNLDVVIGSRFGGRAEYR